MLKSKEEYINFWVEQALDDWQAVDALFQKGKYLQALFFTHLVVEKIAKAYWIKDNESNLPPKTHNLIHLFSQTQLEISEENKEFLLSLNRFQIEGRYPDYVAQLYKICDESFTKEIIDQTEKLKQWLLNKLQ